MGPTILTILAILVSPLWSPFPQVRAIVPILATADGGLAWSA